MFPCFPSTFYFPHFFTPFIFPLLYLPLSPSSFIPYFFSFRLQHLALFYFHGFVGSNFHSPFFVTLTLHPKFRDLCFDHRLNFSLVAGVWLQSISFFMHASPTDCSSTLSIIFYHLYNHGLAGSRKSYIGILSHLSPTFCCFFRYRLSIV